MVRELVDRVALLTAFTVRSADPRSNANPRSEGDTATRRAQRGTQLLEVLFIVIPLVVRLIAAGRTIHRDVQLRIDVICWGLGVAAKALDGYFDIGGGVGLSYNQHLGSLETVS